MKSPDPTSAKPSNPEEGGPSAPPPKGAQSGNGAQGGGKPQAPAGKSPSPANPAAVQPPAAVDASRAPPLTTDGPAPSKSANKPAPSSPMAKFLEEAAPIVAEERGITPQADFLLESLADRLGLSEKGRDDALAKLRSQFEDLSPEAKAKLAKFREAVKQNLLQRQTAILTAKREKELIEQAASKFGLEPAQASLAVREAAADIDVRFVPHEEAVRHIENLIRDRLDKLGYLPTEVEGILKKSAYEWGISADEFAVLVQSSMDKHSEEVRSERRRQTLFIQGVVGTIIVSAVVLIGVIVARQGSWSDTREAKSETQSNTTSTSETVEVKPQSSFWDADLIDAYDRWARSQPRAASIRETLSSNSPDERAKGYQSFADAVVTQKADGAKAVETSVLWQRLYATDPEESAAKALCDASMARLSLPRPLTPIEHSSAPGVSVLLDCLLNAANTSLVAPERRQHLREALANALKLPAPAEEIPKAWATQARSTLAKQWLTELSLAADTQPSLAAQWTLALRSSASAALATNERTGLENEIALRAAQTLTAKDDWATVARLLSDAINSRDNDTVLRVVDVYERTHSKSLSEALSSKLLTRVGLDSAVATADVATEVRKKLGGKKSASSSSSASDSGADRQARWRKLVRANNAVRDRSSSESEVLLRDTVALARLVNLGEALRRGDLHSGWFDKAAGGEITMEAAPAEVEAVAVAGDPLSELTPQERTTLKNYSAALATPKDLAVLKRTSYLHAICTLSDRVNDVPAVEAYGIATYLLMPKGAEEADQVAHNAEKIRKWPRLQIALADGWKNSELDKHHLHQLWVTFTATDGTVSDVHTSRPRRELQQLALRTLSESRGKEKPESAIDVIADRLAQQYVDRLRLRAGEIAPHDAKAGDVLARLLPRVLGIDGADAEQVVAGISLAADNDLQKVVLLQRAIIQRESMILTRVNSSAAGKLQSLVDGLALRDAQSDNVVKQIRDGENTLLSMLMAAYEE